MPGSTTFSMPISTGIVTAISVEEVEALLNIPTITSLKEITQSEKAFFLEAAQKDLEGQLDIKFLPQKITETKDYHLDDIISWNYIPVSYPVKSVCLLKGMYGEQETVTISNEQISLKRSSEGLYYRQLHLVPNWWYGSFGGANFIGNVFGGGWFGYQRVPNFWEVNYITGFDSIPKDLQLVLAKLTAVNILIAQSSGAYSGSTIPVSSGSLSVDGLGQSYSSLLGAGNLLYQPIINQYLQDLEKAMIGIYQRYKGLTFAVL